MKQEIRFESNIFNSLDRSPLHDLNGKDDVLSACDQTVAWISSLNLLHHSTKCNSIVCLNLEIDCVNH